MRNVKLNSCITETGPAVVNVNRPILRGIHHLNFRHGHRADGRAFYRRVLSARRVPEWDHLNQDGTRYATILEVPRLGTHMELRMDAQAAERHRVEMFDTP